MMGTAIRTARPTAPAQAMRMLALCMALPFLVGPAAQGHPADTDGYGIVLSHTRDALHANNVAQQLRFTLDACGFLVRPTEGDDRWLQLGMDAITRGDMALRPMNMPVMTCSASEARVDHGAFAILYTNSEAGLRQDFLVNERLPGRGPLTIHLGVQGTFHPRQASNGDVLFVPRHGTSCASLHGLKYANLFVWDAHGTVLSAHMSADPNGILLHVDDSEAVYPITIDPLTATADTQLEGSQAGERFGHSARTAGDVNGDGYSDIVIGTPYHDDGSGTVGRVQVHYGSASGIQGPPTTIAGTQSGALFGHAVATAGDVNGDGFSDIIIGAPGYTDVNGQVGAVIIHFGSVAGISTTPDQIIAGQQAGASFGHSVSMAGDVNGDGFSEVIIGAPLHDNGHVDEGRAFVYHGSASGLLPTPSWTAESDQDDAHFGTSVSAAGDVNGDGFSDVIVGAPLYDNGQADEGRVFVYHGAISGLASTAAWGAESDQTGANMGASVSSAGDVNGDGYSDVTIGAPLYDFLTTDQGRVYMFRGSTLGIQGSAWISFGGTIAAQARFGNSVSMAGDVNGDGYADIIVGSPGLTGGGRAALFLGGATGFSGANPSWANAAGQAGELYGAQVSVAGDVNGDGISDVLIAAPLFDGTGTDAGRVTVHHGSPRVLHTSSTWTASPGNGAGGSVANAGDVNGDGYGDIIVGTLPGGGRAYLYTGSAAGLSASPSWTAVQGGDFGVSVAGAGDVNGDGYSDVIVGDPGNGRASVFHGSVTGLGGTSAWQHTLGAGSFGYAVSSAGDVNGDGYSDVIVGAPGSGQAFVFLGSATGLGATPAWQHTVGTGSFGHAVGTAGDVNGDGYCDVIVGAPFWGSGGTALVFHGSVVGPSTSANRQYTGTSSEQMGYSVSTAGDVNGDGLSDVIIGSPNAPDMAGESVGRARVFLGGGGGLSTTPHWQEQGLFPGYAFGPPRLGYSVSVAGDVNGDGYSDVLVGSAYFNHSPAYIGKAEVWLGSPAGILPGAAAWSTTGSTTNDRLGTSVSVAGDVNGDGYGDVLIGQPGPSTSTGTVRVFQGNNGINLRNKGRQYRTDLSTPVQTNNGTFEADCSWGIGLFARRAMGRDRVRLSWEVKPHGFPFAGSPLNNNTSYSGESGAWADIGLTGTEITDLPATVTWNSFPTWRARLRHHPATMIDGQPFSRWTYQGINDRQAPSVKVDLDACGPLPVTLAWAHARCGNGQALLEWATASETNSAYFEVESSTDQQRWIAHGQVLAAEHSSTLIRYTWSGYVPASPVSYLRLVQHDLDGSTEVLHTMSLPPCGEDGLTACPNPTSGPVSIHSTDWGAMAGGSVHVCTRTGQAVRVHPLPGSFDEGELRMDLGGLSAGAYILLFRDATGLVRKTVQIAVLP